MNYCSWDVFGVETSRWSSDIYLLPLLQEIGLNPWPESTALLLVPAVPSSFLFCLAKSGWSSEVGSGLAPPGGPYSQPAPPAQPAPPHPQAPAAGGRLWEAPLD